MGKLLDYMWRMHLKGSGSPTQNIMMTIIKTKFLASHTHIATPPQNNTGGLENKADMHAYS